MRIFGGFILVIVGALVTIYAEQLYNMFGVVPVAEKYLGSEGGSRLFYKLFGILLAVLGAMIMTNMLGPLLLSIFGGIFGGAQ